MLSHRVRDATRAGCVAATPALAGVVAFSVGRWRRVRTRLFDLEVDAETAAVRDRVREAEARSHRHAMVNALVAVEGATLLLHRDTLSASERASLRSALDGGVDRLRLLVTDEEGHGGGVVSLAEVASRLAEDTRWSERLQPDVAADLRGAGSPGQTEEALRQLLIHVNERTPASPISVRGEGDAEWSVLWVDDRGPAMSHRRRRLIECVGQRSDGQDDIALHVACRLVQGQGGELRIENRQGGGCSFGLCVPAAGEGIGGQVHRPGAGHVSP